MLSILAESSIIDVSHNPRYCSALFKANVAHVPSQLKTSKKLKKWAEKVKFWRKVEYSTNNPIAKTQYK